ncbi:MAG: sugar transferase, partial [Candidatus Xenobia bacterium]
MRVHATSPYLPENVYRIPRGPSVLFPLAQPLRPRMWKMRVWLKREIWVCTVRGAEHVKRILDVVVSLLAGLVLLPVMLAVALLIKADGGPVLYWQTRVGRHGREFRFPKFRSMIVNADRLKDQLMAQNQHADGVTFKIKKDPRITRIGRIIRKTSIDELPQLWCVLKGEMTLVGPRPPLPREVALYTLEQRRRLDVTPGHTCIWQVSGRGDIGFTRQVELDVEYIESRSLWFDFKLLLLTVV